MSVDVVLAFISYRSEIISGACLYIALYVCLFMFLNVFPFETLYRRRFVLNTICIRIPLINMLCLCQRFIKISVRISISLVDDVSLFN